MAAEDFNMALQIRYVAIKKLTQTLCLVNANEFLPYDDAILSLGISDATPRKAVDWEAYQNDTTKIRDKFPGCRPYEISLFAYESSKSNKPLKVSPDRCFQIVQTFTTTTETCGRISPQTTGPTPADPAKEVGASMSQTLGKGDIH